MNGKLAGRTTIRRRFGQAGIAAALALMAGMASPAWAQYELDRNLQVGSGGINPQRPDMAAEMRFRNAIVTGNAPGGLSFRGDVGYRAPGEFSALMGADDTFSFRRDSVYSGLGGLGIRGTDALQYQFAMTTGRTPPPGVGFFPGGVPRAATGVTAGAVRADPMDVRAEGVLPAIPPRWRPGDEAEDLRGMSLAAMRTPSAFVTMRTFQPTHLGTTMSEEGMPIGITASVLRGLTYGPVVTGRDLERTEQVDSPAERAGLVPPRTEDPQERRVEMGMEAPRSPYEEIMDRIRLAADERPGEEEGVARRPGEEPELRGGTFELDWRNRLGDLRMQLQEPMAAERQRIVRGLDPRFESRRDPTDIDREEAEEGREFRPETIEMLRRAGQVDVLAPPGFDAYATHMESGQKHLATGRYFDAEERFTAALSVRPADPMASVGQIHAALGAGMYLSAAINLRDVLTTNPELVGVRYDQDLLPSPERLEYVQEQLSQLMRTRPMQARESGMLMAYVGFQTGNEAMMERGLSEMEAPPPDGEPLLATDEQMIRLATLLREVWSDSEEAPAENKR